jgi:enoyl-CoA hydratase/carnithine racemase
VATEEFAYTGVTFADGVALIVVEAEAGHDPIDELCRQLLQLQADEAVRAIVVTGSGGVFFPNTTIDSEAATALIRKKQIARSLESVPLALVEVDKPVIAAVNGLAFGSGFDVALAMDIRLAARSARFCATAPDVHSLPAGAACYFLPRLVGPARALEILLSGGPVDAVEATRIGIVNHLCEDEQLLEEAMGLGRRIASRAPITVQMIKRATYQSARTDLRTALDLISSHLAVVRSTHDAEEARAAFREKRTPRFEGR